MLMADDSFVIVDFGIGLNLSYIYQFYSNEEFQKGYFPATGTLEYMDPIVKK